MTDYLPIRSNCGCLMSSRVVSTLVLAYCHSILLFFRVFSELNHTAAILYCRDTHNISWAIKSARNELPCYELYREFFFCGNVLFTYINVDSNVLLSFYLDYEIVGFS